MIATPWRRTPPHGSEIGRCIPVFDYHLISIACLRNAKLKKKIKKPGKRLKGSAKGKEILSHSHSLPS
jgi:hypothetical protein